MATTAKELLENRKELLQKAQAYNAENHAEGKKWTGENQQELDRMIAESSAMKDEADSLLKLETAVASLDESGNDGASLDGKFQGPQAGLLNPPKKKSTIRIRNGWESAGVPKYEHVEIGKRGTDDYRAAYNGFMANGTEKLQPEQLAALQSDNSTQAGYLVASEQLAAGVLETVDDLLFIRRYAKIHTVREAHTLGIRKKTAKASTFGWSSELQVSTEDSTLAYGKKVLTPHHLTGLIKVSRDLVRRSMVGIEGEVSSELARDAGELMEDAYLTGSGAQQPLGVFTASADGISTGRDELTGSTTGYTLAGLVGARMALKSQYRRNTMGQVRWLLPRTGIEKIMLILDGQNQPIFKIGAGRVNEAGNVEDMLLGYPVDESERCPSTFTASQYVGMLANWNYYEIADALDMEMQRLDELYAATNQIGFIARLKTDGMPTLEEAFVRLKTDAS